MEIPPQLSQGRSRMFLWLALIIGAIVVVLAVGGLIAYHSVIASGVTSGLDNKFGDQNLKTAVALIELHKVRFGKYPDSLRDLKFTGEWDQIALASVRYQPSPDRRAYYLEVERGWIGKPTFTMPPEFWKGTGFSSSLKPAKR